MIAVANHSDTQPSAFPTIAIIGGGFSGVAVACHLCAGSTRPLRVLLFERAAEIGRGVAYGNPDESLLLNVPAQRMNLWPNRPERSFFEWAKVAKGATDRTAFLPRTWFGQYTQHELIEAVGGPEGRHIFWRVQAQVLRARPDGRGQVALTDDRGRRYLANRVVLATGNGPSRLPAPLVPLLGVTDQLIVNPWSEEGLARAHEARRVLLVGTGLTMMDVAVGMARGGSFAQIIAVSRRGLLPRAHGPSHAAAHAQWVGTLSGRTLKSLLHAVRDRARQAEVDQTGWRSVIDAMRPHTTRLWNELPRSDRQKFLRQIAVWWDVHRHRCPQEVYSVVQVWRERGRLAVLAGELTSARLERTGEISVEVRPRGGHLSIRMGFDAVVLCTGPDGDVTRSKDELLSDLLQRGEVAPHTLGLGFRRMPWRARCVPMASQVRGSRRSVRFARVSFGKAQRYRNLRRRRGIWHAP
ncbi:MAG: FAD/NAD(P)-binding protein [Phycisphaeraceae bacterium]|nr:FAD/NAD(P)-binding protein [Phycisphaeraceae bacterium]